MDPEDAPPGGGHGRERCSARPHPLRLIGRPARLHPRSSLSDRHVPAWHPPRPRPVVGQEAIRPARPGPARVRWRPDSRRTPCLANRNSLKKGAEPPRPCWAHAHGSLTGRDAASERPSAAVLMPTSPRRIDHCGVSRRPVRVVGSPTNSSQPGTAPRPSRHRASTAILALRSKSQSARRRIRAPYPGKHPGIRAMLVRVPFAHPACHRLHSLRHHPGGQTPLFMVAAAFRRLRQLLCESLARTRARTCRAPSHSLARSHPAPGCDSPKAPSGS